MEPEGGGERVGTRGWAGDAYLKLVFVRACSSSAGHAAFDLLAEGLIGFLALLMDSERAQAGGPSNAITLIAWEPAARHTSVLTGSNVQLAQGAARSNALRDILTLIPPASLARLTYHAQYTRLVKLKLGYSIANSPIR